MTQPKGKTLVEVFAAEQELACKQLDRIKTIMSRGDRAKSLVVIDEEESEEIKAICDAVKARLRGRRQRLASLVRGPS